jgi:hypothetical protein
VLKALVPEMGEIDAVLQRAGLGSFSDALAGYGLECINDLDQVSLRRLIDKICCIHFAQKHAYILILIRCAENLLLCHLVPLIKSS